MTHAPLKLTHRALLLLQPKTLIALHLAGVVKRLAVQDDYILEARLLQQAQHRTAQHTSGLTLELEAQHSTQAASLSKLLPTSQQSSAQQGFQQLGCSYNCFYRMKISEHHAQRQGAGCQEHHQAQ